jgi:hypothetical protein
MFDQGIQYKCLTRENFSLNGASGAASLPDWQKITAIRAGVRVVWDFHLNSSMLILCDQVKLPILECQLAQNKTSQVFLYPDQLENLHLSSDHSWDSSLKRWFNIERYIRERKINLEQMEHLSHPNNRAAPTTIQNGSW